MAKPRTPANLGRGGAKLWRELLKEHEDLDVVQLVQLEEACRAKDRLDKLNEILRGDVDTWASLVHDVRTEDYELRIDAALTSANATANVMKQLIAALRLPDKSTGKRPQQRGGARGAYVPGGSDAGDEDKPKSPLGALRGIQGGKGA